jgi:hypothetical protein
MRELAGRRKATMIPRIIIALYLVTVWGILLILVPLIQLSVAASFLFDINKNASGYAYDYE